MKLPLSQLKAHLDRGLKGIYLVAADEPLLVAEATDAIRRTAIGQGFDERQVHFVERGFRWDMLAAAGDNLSLFSSRRILELRMGSPRPGDAGAKAIRELAETGDPDRLVIVSIQDKLDSSAQKSVWVRTIEQHGVVVDIRAVMRHELPRFIQARAKQRGLQIEADAAELLADRTEGNLLAADQELTKLALIADGSRVDADAVLAAVATSARFDVFRLGDAIVAGDAARAMTVLDGLRNEDAPPTLVLWAIVREILVLAELKRAEAAGESLEPLMGRLRIWRNRQPQVRKALRRYSERQLAALVADAARVDRTVKGIERAPVWTSITDLVLDLLVPARHVRTA